MRASRVVLICGGRDFSDAAMLSRALGSCVGLDDTILHGGAQGADALAGAWATRHGHVSICVPADWKAYGTAAGPIRNKRMLVEFKPDLVVAFPGGKGTAHMVEMARRRGVEVVEVTE